jgi:single-strand DNA-binding protein
VNLNKAFILGNVTRDPEVRSMPNGGQVTSFSIATNRFYTSSQGEKKTEAEFHNIVCFGKLADISARYLTKGSLIFIEGRIKTRNWQDTAGVKHYKTEIIADSLQLGPRGSGSPSGGSNYKSSAYAEASADKAEQSKQDEIPIIEENYTPPANDNPEDQKTVSLEDNAADEIDVKDIPF